MNNHPTAEDFKRVFTELKNAADEKLNANNNSRRNVAHILYLIGDTTSAAKTLRHGPPLRIYYKKYSYIIGHLSYHSHCPMIESWILEENQFVLSWEKYHPFHFNNNLIY